jgi:predicted 3-demethylubiquinone-9 3-methyltransferase (glyoxalase superfamily)
LQVSHAQTREEVQRHRRESRSRGGCDRHAAALVPRGARRPDEFGMCVDRFGIGWMVNIGQPQG